MALRNIADLRQSLPPARPVMGLDVGEKTIGLALSDATRTVATPLQTIRRAKLARDAETLSALIAENGIAALIVGLPVNMDGSEGPRCQSVRAFARELLKRIDIDIAFWDERLSTAAVSRAMIEADMSRARRRQMVDKLAAAYILQGALDSLARPGAGGTP